MNIIYSAIYVCISIIIIISIYSFLAYYYSTYQNDMTDSHVLFIREPINGTTPNQQWKADKILPATSAYTFSTWLLINQFDKTPGYKMIFMKGSVVTNVQPAVFLSEQNDEIKIHISTGQNSSNIKLPGDPDFDKNAINIITVPNIPTGVWFSIAIIVDNTIANIFINGMLVKSQVLPGSVNIQKDDNIYVGPSASEQNIVSSSGFNGKIAQLRYYPKVLTTNEIQEIYNLGLTPIYNPVSKAIDMVDKVDTDISHGIDMIKNKLKPIARDVESVGNRLVNAVKNTSAYKELAKLTRESEKEIGKGLSGAGSILDTAGKELIYGADWQYQTQYMLNDPKLMNESCNTSTYQPFKVDSGNISNNYNNDCVTDCDCYYTSTCNNGKCGPLTTYDTNDQKVTINYKRMVGKGDVIVNTKDKPALDKYPYNTKLSNSLSYLTNEQSRLNSSSMAGNMNYQLCRNSCNKVAECDGYLFNTGNSSSKDCNEDESKCGPQNMCYLINNPITQNMLPTETNKLFNNSNKYVGIFKKITKDKDGKIIPNIVFNPENTIPTNNEIPVSGKVACCLEFATLSDVDQINGDMSKFVHSWDNIPPGCVSSNINNPDTGSRYVWYNTDNNSKTPLQSNQRIVDQCNNLSDTDSATTTSTAAVKAFAQSNDMLTDNNPALGPAITAFAESPAKVACCLKYATLSDANTSNGNINRMVKNWDNIPPGCVSSNIYNPDTGSRYVWYNTDNNSKAPLKSNQSLVDQCNNLSDTDSTAEASVAALAAYAELSNANPCDSCTPSIYDKSNGAACAWWPTAGGTAAAGCAVGWTESDCTTIKTSGVYKSNGTPVSASSKWCVG